MTCTPANPPRKSHPGDPSRSIDLLVPPTSRPPANDVAETIPRSLELPHPPGHTFAGSPPGNLLGVPAR